MVFRGADALEVFVPSGACKKFPCVAHYTVDAGLTRSTLNTVLWNRWAHIYPMTGVTGIFFVLLISTGSCFVGCLDRLIIRSV